jgi:hypothetical protein
MGQTVTKEDLLNELALFVSGGYSEIQPGEISFADVCKRTGTKITTLYRRTERGEIPAGFEVVERRGHNGQIMKCYRKV